MVAVSRTTCAGRDNSGHFHITGGVGLSFWLFQHRYCSSATGGSRYHGSDSGFDVPTIKNRSIALGSLFVMTLLCTRISTFSPLYIGRQVLGEMPAMFFLFARFTWLCYQCRRGECGRCPWPSQKLQHRADHEITEFFRSGCAH